MPGADRIDWVRTLPFILMHAACLFAFVVGVSPIAIDRLRRAVLHPHVRDHRFLSPLFLAQVLQDLARRQFLFGVLGSSAVQRGPIWWAAHHRDHHQYSDKKEDAHSPIQHGFVRAHMSWFLSKKGFAPDLKRVRDLMSFPELRWLDRFDIIVPVLLAVAVFFLGVALEKLAPGLGTNGWQMLVWGFFVSTVLTLARHLHHQLAVARVRQAALQDRRFEPQQLVPRADHARRGLAQQPPPLPELDAPGLLLVGNRHHLLPAQGDVVDGDHLGPEAGSGRGARSPSAPHRRNSRLSFPRAPGECRVRKVGSAAL